MISLRLLAPSSCLRAGMVVRKSRCRASQQALASRTWLTPLRSLVVYEQRGEFAAAVELSVPSRVRAPHRGEA
jgi:hypothetical protein